jgi:hypothetical protein
MATITWTGAAHDGLFSDANNWAGNTLPGTADVAIIAPGVATTITSGTAGSPSVSQFSMTSNVTLDINAFTGFTAIAGTTGSGIAGTVNIANNAGLSLNGISTIAGTGTINITNSAVLSLSGTVSNAGTINQQGGANTTTISILQNTTLTGGGHIVLSAASTNFIYNNNSVTLDNLNNTISGGGNIGNFGNLQLVNGGIIDANAPTAPLTIDPAGTAVNTGTLEATAGATLDLNSLVNSNGGTVPPPGPRPWSHSIRACSAGPSWPPAAGRSRVTAPGWTGWACTLSPSTVSFRS